MNYYNEFDKPAAEWLRQLIKLGAIPDGVVDERSIEDVRPEELKNYKQCHFFCGIGGFPLALRRVGIPDDFPIWTGSCPCFPAGTLVLTARGNIPIEQVTVGDLVWTHKKQWQKVIRTGSDPDRDTVIVKGQGHWGLECTPNHPFLVEDGRFVEAKDLKGKRWVCFDGKIPYKITHPIPDFGRTKRFCVRNGRYRVSGTKNNKTIYLGTYDSFYDANVVYRKAIADGRIDVRGAEAADVKTIGFAKWLGFWVGNGWCTGDKIVICDECGSGSRLLKMTKDAGLCGCVSKEQTGDRCSTGSRYLSVWLFEHFGKGAKHKKLPIWLYGMPDDWINSFFEGWIEADGCKTKEQLATTSESLAIGAIAVMIRLDLSPTVKKVKVNPTRVIEGRTVNQNDWYQIRYCASNRQFKSNHLGGIGLVRSVTPTGQKKRVYNLEVENDNTYVAAGLICHNCQSFSTAGLGKGMDDTRDLWPAFFNLIKECRPDHAIGEQVEAAIRFGWLDRLRHDVESEGYAVGSAVLGAFSAGAPHIRKRLYWSAHRLPNTEHNGLSAADGTRTTSQSPLAQGECVGQPAGGGDTGGMEHVKGERREDERAREFRSVIGPVPAGAARRASDTHCLRHEGAGCEKCEGRPVDQDGGDGHADGGMEDTNLLRRRGGCAGHGEGHQPSLPSAGHEHFNGMVVTPRLGRGGGDEAGEGAKLVRSASEGSVAAGGDVNTWRNIVGAHCLDNKVRPFEPGVLPLVARVSRDVGHSGDPRSPEYANDTEEAFAMRLKGYGNAINIGTATLYIRALIEEGLL